ncbi:phosphodiesterase [Streptomyces dubilierae]|uniref:Phosphodiesterase n=1 Tax=Streptomyces dubilierae TaxID=3075533 RepID=A0ABU2P274_9ACTN|nr:phosphodiesterase [Streptomyces sp. DSM 41921]MDT0386243.1 phosphodiesterase [Streptomyces sp. DSM 41921]
MTTPDVSGDTVRTAATQPSPPSRPVALVEAGFRALARLRRAPALHPQGLTCGGELEVVDDGGGSWDVPWLDTPRRLDATVRLSRAGGLPRRLPDGLGLAVRVPDADGPGRTLDLLMTSSGRGRAGRHVPLPRADALRGPYSSLLPYRVAGRSCLLAAFPRRTRQAPVPGDPRSMAAALADGPLVYDLCAETGDRAWRRFGVLTVTTVLPVGQEDTLDFDIYHHSVRAFVPGTALAATRRAAYRGSRSGRDGA